MSDSIEAQEVPSFIRRTGLTNWNRYAAVNDEFVAMHMDDSAGRTFGFSGAIGMGNLQIAYIHNFLRDWMGDVGRIARVACEFRAPNLKDTIVTVQGAVTTMEASPDLCQAHVVFTVTGSNGPDERGVVLARGTATVERSLRNPTHAVSETTPTAHCPPGEAVGES